MSSTLGYLYILTNKNIPGLVKVGYTNRDPYLRATELSSTTGVPGYWKVVKSWRFEDAYAAEQLVFTRLKQHKEKGEFLKLPEKVAVEKISAVLLAHGFIDTEGISIDARAEAISLKRINDDSIERTELEKYFKTIETKLTEAIKSATNRFFIRNIEEVRVRTIIDVWENNGFGYLFGNTAKGFKDSRGFTLDDETTYESVGHGGLRNRLTNAIYKKDKDYLLVGEWLPVVNVIFPGRVIFVNKYPAS